MSSSHSLIVIQHICTTWTKASRGGDNASARNRTPEVLALPSAVVSIPEHVFLLHKVMYDEYQHFQNPMQKLEQKEQTSPFQYDCLKLSLIETTLHMTLVWQRYTGAPVRLNLSRKGFSLQGHQWGRVIYNLRTSWNGWEYKKHVLNFGFFPLSSPTLFLETQPAHSYVDMAKLR